MSVACYLLLLDSPSLSPGWLTPDEIRFLEVRQLASSSHSAHDGAFSKRVIFSVLTDWKIYLLILANWSNAVPNYALKFSMPEIVKSMGYKSAKAQLLTIPPYAIGAASAYGFSVFADRSRGECHSSSSHRCHSLSRFQYYSPKPPTSRTT